VIYLDNILSGLLELSDLSFQGRVWTGNTPGEMSSFGDVACDLFNGTGLSEALADGTLSDIFGAAAARVIQELESAVDAVDEDLSIEDLISSPEMCRVREFSKRALDLVKSQKQDAEM
jgi:hypothetical protein